MRSRSARPRGSSETAAADARQVVRPRARANPPRVEQLWDSPRVTVDLDRSSRVVRDWADEAIRRVEADANRSADTHLVPFPLPPSWSVDLYLKDESTHPTGSLKHRL